MKTFLFSLVLISQSVFGQTFEELHDAPQTRVPAAAKQRYLAEKEPLSTGFWIESAFFYKTEKGMQPAKWARRFRGSTTYEIKNPSGRVVQTFDLKPDDTLFETKQGKYYLVRASAHLPAVELPDQTIPNPENVDLTLAEKAAIHAINLERLSKGMSALQVSKALMEDARAKAAAAAVNRDLDAGLRTQKVGVAYQGLFSSGTPRECAKGMCEPEQGGNSTLMISRKTKIGISGYLGEGSSEDSYWIAEVQ